jgi:hypothetical protein
MKEIIRKILREETKIDDVVIRPSINGMINFFVLDEMLVYRYQLSAKPGPMKSRPLQVKLLDMNTGEMTVYEPQSNEEITEIIPKETITNIIQNFKNKVSFKNLYEFKKKGFSVVIDLDFYDTQPINKKG